MGILNFRVLPYRAIVVVDTDFPADTPARSEAVQSHAAGLFTITNKNLAVCSHNIDPAMLRDVAQQCADMASLDEIRSQLGETLRGLAKRHGTQRAGLSGIVLYDRKALTDGTVFVMGWSRALGRMAAVQFQQVAGDLSWVAQHTGESLIFPDLGDDQICPIETDPALNIAAKQLREIRSQQPGLSTGSGLVIAALTYRSGSGVYLQVQTKAH